MRNLYCFITFLFLLSCTSSKGMLEKIQGYWALGKDDNVVFLIKNNDVIYPEDEGKLKLHLNNNVMELSEEGHFITKWQVIKITSDSLFLKMEDSTLVKYVKIK